MKGIRNRKIIRKGAPHNGDVAEIIDRYPALAEKVRKGFMERVPGAKLRVAPKEQPEARPAAEKPKERKFKSTNDVLAAFKSGRL